MQLLPMSTDPRGSWPLGADLPATPPSEPGESVMVHASFVGPRALIVLRIGHERRLWRLDPGGGVPVSTPGSWRVDEILIDEVAADHLVAALEAEAEARADRSMLVVHGDLGRGSRVTIRATNVGATASYFYATWELGEVVGAPAAVASPGMTRVEFRLTMPGRGSWDSRWSGEGHDHLLVRDVGAAWAAQLDGQTWSYGWPDGWRAEVSARSIPDDETLRPSRGFCGYAWMVASILRYGKIYADHERPVATPEEGVDRVG